MAALALSPFKQEAAETSVYPLLGERLELTQPRCGHFESCGGCHVQQLPYALQLVYKRELVRRAFVEAGRDPGELLAEVLGMDDPWHYRNKADLGVRPLGGVARLGFTHAGGRRIFEVIDCPISSPEINLALAAFREVLPRWGALKRKLHSVIIRSSRSERKAAVLFHTRLKDAATFQRLGAELMEACPVVKGVAYVDRGREVRSGDTALSEQIGGFEYTYSLGSFFQANPLQAQVLVETVLELAEPSEADVAADLYSGVGLFTLPLARRVREVHAIEDTPLAVSDAMANAVRAGLGNCRFLRGRAHDQLDTLARFGTRIDLMVIDPPRSGCSQETLEAIPRFGPRRLIYVSCNPASLARDAVTLERAGFDLDAVRPVDMFPQTSHVECVARFVR